MKKNKNIKQFNLNFGPQHPAAHGVLRLSLVLNNERVYFSDTQIGLLHRGTENLIIKKNFLLSLPYFDRLDYVSMLTQEHSYCLALEKKSKKNINIFLQKTRVVLDELTRVLNHFLAVACHSLDVGSMSPIFWSFEERENLMEVYENFSGARMHAAAFKPFFFGKTLNTFLIKKIIFNIKNIYITLTEINTILVFNKIWKIRLKNIGVVNFKNINSFFLTGILERSFGTKKDLRVLKKTKYSFYRFFKLKSFITKNGDSFDSFLLRVLEMFESLNILNFLTFNFFNKKTKTFKKHYKFIENTINVFKFWTKNTNIKKKTYFYIESPKGCFGLFLINKKNKPIFCRIKSPSYNNLFFFNNIVIGHQIADLVTLIGTIDIVFGEIDR